MPASPLPPHNDLVTYKLLSDGSMIPDTYEVRLIEVERHLNRIPRARIELLDGSPAEQTFEASESDYFLPGNEIEIKAGYHSDDQTIFKGIVVSQALRIRGDSHSVLEVTCLAKAVKLTAGRKHALYADMKDSDIISQLIQNAGLSASVDETRLQHKTLVQYQSTDWDFLLSRAEANGRIVHVTDTAVEVKAPDVSASPELVITYGRDMIGVKLDMEATEQFGSVTTESWDDAGMAMLSANAAAPSEPSQGNVTGSTLSDVLGTPAYLWRSPANLPQQEIQAWADARLLRSRLSRIQGELSFQGSALAQPNSLIELAGLGARFNGQAYISGLRHVIKAGNWVTHTTLGLSNTWFVEQHANVDDRAASDLLPAIKGLQVGVVTKIHEDPDGRHRIQVKIPTLTNDQFIWARMAHLYATNNAGTFFLPEIGDEVLLGFLNQDPRHPVVLGMLYNGQKVPPYTADEANTYKAIVSKNQVKIIIEDEKKILTLETPAGNTVILDDDQENITIKDQHGNSITMSSEGIVMDSIKDIKLTAQSNISAQATQNLELQATQNLTGQGLNVEFKGDVGFKAEGSATAELKASGQTTVKGAMVMIN